MKKTVGVAISLLLMANALFAQAKSLDKNNAYYVYNMYYDDLLSFMFM